MTLAPEIATRTLTLTRTTHAPVKQLYNAFLSRDGVYYWLSDDAHIQAAVGGHILLVWDNGAQHAYGRFTELEPEKHIAFNLQEQNTPEIDVDVTIKETDSIVTITLTLTGILSEETAARLEKDWNARMDNLVSFVETGADLRVTRRVIIGIFPANLDENTAKRLGVPVNDGVRVTGLVDGYSAQQAGLKTDDVIVEFAGNAAGQDKPMFRSVADKKPGDTVEVVYYRGAEKRTATMTLKGYPVPPMPADFSALAENTAQLCRDLDSEMTALFEEVTEAEAEKKPAPEEWNVKEVLAHLILSERWRHHWLGGFVQGPEVQGYTANATLRLAAVITVHPTLKDLTAEFNRSMQETVALLRAFPVENQERRANLWWIVFELGGMAQHTRGHFEQIKAAITAARA
jgi:uncharacterized protein YndB with AHSA1/START domain